MITMNAAGFLVGLENPQIFDRANFLPVSGHRRKTMWRISFALPWVFAEEAGMRRGFFWRKPVWSSSDINPLAEDRSLPLFQTKNAPRPVVTCCGFQAHSSFITSFEQPNDLIFRRLEMMCFCVAAIFVDLL